MTDEQNAVVDDATGNDDSPLNDIDDNEVVEDGKGKKSEKLGVYEAKRCLLIDKVGKLHPNTDLNRKAKLPSQCVLSKDDAKRYGSSLKPVRGVRKGETRNKIIEVTHNK